MHEMSLCEGILQVIEAEAQKQQFTEVTQVVLDIGVLSAVETSALEFAFEVIMHGSVAEKAILKINKILSCLCHVSMIINMAWFKCQLSEP